MSDQLSCTINPGHTITCILDVANPSNRQTIAGKLSESIEVRNRKIVCTLNHNRPLTARISANHSLMCIIKRTDDAPIYVGEYEVTPRKDDPITLYTHGRNMSGDIIIHEIPYYETTNLSGWYTVIIG